MSFFFFFPSHFKNWILWKVHVLVPCRPTVWSLTSLFTNSLEVGTIYLFRFWADWQLLSSKLKLTAWLKVDLLKDRFHWCVCVCGGEQGRWPKSHLTCLSICWTPGQLCHWQLKSGHNSTKDTWKSLGMFFFFFSYSGSEILKIVYLDPWLYGGTASGKGNGRSIQRGIFGEKAYENCCVKGQIWHAFFSSCSLKGWPSLVSRKGGILKGLILKQLQLNMQLNPLGEISE